MQTENVSQLISGTFNDITSTFYNDIKRAYPPEVLTREFKTLRLKLPRRLGVSTAVFNLMDDHENTLMVVPSTKIREYNINAMNEYLDRSRAIELSSKILIFGTRDCEPNNPKINDIDMMFFDPFPLFTSQPELIRFMTAINDRVKMFVILG